MEPWFEIMVGCLGKVWRTNRRRLKPHVKDAFAALLLEVRLDYLPDVYLDTASNIGRSRCDIRGVTELLRHVAARPAPPIEANAVTFLPPSPFTPEERTSCCAPSTPVKVTNVCRKHAGHGSNLDVVIASPRVLRSLQHVSCRAKSCEAVSAAEVRDDPWWISADPWTANATPTGEPAVEDNHRSAVTEEDRAGAKERDSYAGLASPAPLSVPPCADRTCVGVGAVVENEHDQTVNIVSFYISSFFAAPP